ncbi:MAG: alanine racemase [Bacteroidaceae bacterium]|nr:alanine racemase [Bacteroidaceae bacterium]
MSYTTQTIAQFLAPLGVQRVGETEYPIQWLLTDSRSLSSPEDTLFFALTTPRGDGHRYIPQLYQRGVRSFVVSQVPEGQFDEATFFLVPDTLRALQQVAHAHRSQFQIPVVGIAGSNGKTMVKEWLYQMLSPDHTVARSPRSYNSQIGVPLSVWTLTPDTEIGIFEAAISQPGEMDSLEHIIRPTIGVFTGLGDAHQDNFNSYKQKCMEKLQLFRHADVLVYPTGNRVVDICIRQLNFHGQFIPVAMPEGSSPWELDKELCVAVCRYLGMDEGAIQQRRQQLEPIPMRLEVMNGQNGCTLINDSYNNDPDSLKIALEFMNRRPNEQERSHTLILSDMQQTGTPDDVLYTAVAQLIKKHAIRTFIGVGEGICAQAVSILKHSGAECHFFPDTADLLTSKVFSELHDEVILIKGARSFHFEDLVSRLEEQVHETILEVDLNGIVANLNYYRSLLRPGVRIICMVKADAYGAGSVEVARLLQDNGVDYMAVAVADEGVELRQAGISTGIMIMNPEMTSFRTLFRYSLEPEVYSFRLLDALIHAAEREGIKGFPVHIKLDTGMHRLGFDPVADMPRLLERLKGQSAILPRSVFSHFVGSDSDQFDEFSARQFQLFQQGAEALQKAYPKHSILRHICNSAAIEHFPERQMDMVRLGLGLYGINSRNNQIINNVSTLKTTILQIHDVPRNETVGYSRKGRLQRDSRIAVLPIGYADGLDRHLGNGRAYCLVNGRPAPYVGNICMDVCMIDVTDVPCREGDTAVIFGHDLPVTVLSDTTGTIPYEILTSVSNRVKRVYFKK